MNIIRWTNTSCHASPPETASCNTPITQTLQQQVYVILETQVDLYKKLSYLNTDTETSEMLITYTCLEPDYYYSNLKPEMLTVCNANPNSQRKGNCINSITAIIKR